MRVRVVLLAAAAALLLAAGAEARRCKAEDYECVSKRAFCLDGKEMRCSDGTECTGSVDGGSPCTEGQSWKRERCHGRWDDRGCCDSKHYCHGGRKVKCPSNTKCWGSDDGEQPCKHHRPKPDDCGDKCDSDDWDKDHTCPDGDWKCTSDTTYCEGGREIKCPLDYVCKDYAPCVKRNPCPDDWDCPDCNGKSNFTCINHRDYCLGGRCYMCPEGTRCTGTDDPEKSPCTPELPPEPCPGSYSDFQCIDSRRYCLDNAIVECPNDGWCHGNADEAPCKSEKPTEPTCSGDDFECYNKDSFCHEGIVHKCPSDLICKGGPIPCVLEYDDTCSASDNSCLDWNDFCLGGWRYTCPEGYRCVKPEEEGQSPCVPEDWEDRWPKVDKRCWTDFDDYTCFDASHYCLDGMSVWCGRDKFCNPNAIDEDEPICVEQEPDLKTCDEAGYGEWTCIDDRNFCHRGLVVECPDDFVCKGASPYPCVQRCPCDDCEECWKDDDHKDDCGDEFCDHPTPQPHPSPEPDCHDCPVPHPSPKPDCPGGSCTKVTVITKIVIIKKYSCEGDGWSCKGSDYCDGGKHWGCPEGTKCDPNWDGKGGSCCKPVQDPCLCDGPRYNYECIDNRRFCLGGYIKACPAGTYCMGSNNGENPCKPLLQATPSPCPNGENCCTSKYEYCSGGNTYSCRGGHVCEKFAPCVWPSYDPCIVDPTATGCWNDCDKYPNAPGCVNDPCTRDPKSCWWRSWPERDDCNCKNRASRCYDFCCEFPNTPQCNWQTGGQATLVNNALPVCDCNNPATAECAAQCNAQALQQAAAACDCAAPATGECAAQCALQAEQAAVQQQQQQAQQEQEQQQQPEVQPQVQAQPAVAAAVASELPASVSPSPSPSPVASPPPPSPSPSPPPSPSPSPKPTFSGSTSSFNQEPVVVVPAPRPSPSPSPVPTPVPSPSPIPSTSTSTSTPAASPSPSPNPSPATEAQPAGNAEAPSPPPTPDSGNGSTTTSPELPPCPEGVTNATDCVQPGTVDLINSGEGSSNGTEVSNVTDVAAAPAAAPTPAPTTRRMVRQRPTAN